MFKIKDILRLLEKCMFVCILMSVIQLYKMVCINKKSQDNLKNLKKLALFLKIMRHKNYTLFLTINSQSIIFAIS